MEIIHCLKELHLPRQIVELILFTERTLKWCLARCLKMTNRPGVALRGHWHPGCAEDGPRGKPSWNNHPGFHRCQQQCVTTKTNYTNPEDRPHQLEGTRRYTNVLEGYRGRFLERLLRWDLGNHKDRGCVTLTEAAHSLGLWAAPRRLPPTGRRCRPSAYVWWHLLLEEHSYPLGKENKSQDRHGMFLAILTRFSTSVRASTYVLTLLFWWSSVYRRSVAWSDCCSQRAVYRLLKLIWKACGADGGKGLLSKIQRASMETHASADEHSRGVHLHTIAKLLQIGKPWLMHH